MTRCRARAACALAAALVTGCGDAADERRSSGAVVISAVADADILFPPLVASLQGKQIVDQIFDFLADIGDSLNTLGSAGFEPRLAQSWEWSTDSTRITFKLNPRARWHDGAPVRAEDVRFSWALTTDSALGAPLAANLSNVAAMDVVDSATVRVTFKERRPEQFFELVYNLAILPSHLLKDTPPSAMRTSAFARAPVGSGRFRFVRWQPGSVIELAADTTNYRGAPLLRRAIWSVSSDFQAATLKFLAEEADFIELLRPDMLADALKRQHVRALPYTTLNYGYMAFNFREPLSPANAHRVFGEAGARRAISMAIDRHGVVRNVFDTLGRVGRGPFPSALAPARAPDPPAFDSAAAARLLDSLGWRAPAAGAVRERGGRRLSFGILVPTSSAIRMRMAVLVQEQLRRIGADARVESVDAPTFFDRLRRGQFDAMINGWQTDPSPAAIRQIWGSRGALGEGSNFGTYMNPVFDALVDSGAAEFNPRRRAEYFERAYATIVADAPAVWLFEVMNVAGVHRRLRLPPLRADAWWRNLSEWTVPRGEEIARDTAPTR